MTAANQQDSMLSTLLIIMVIVLLCAISTSLQMNVDRMVVAPLEKMTSRLMTLATDILKGWKATVKADVQAVDEDDENLEDLLLEKMIEKISKFVDLKSEIHHGVELDGTENLDHATKSWLKKSYTKPEVVAPASNYTVELVGSNSAEELRLQELLSDFKTVDLAVLDSWAFDVLEHTHNELFEVFGYIYGRLDVYHTFSLPAPVFMAFLAELSNRYVNSNTYHNFRHGCDVGFTVWRLLTVPGLEVAFNHLEMFAILTAALAHDVGHPGVNNAYLVKAKHPLALGHNDRSPLENFHCVELYNILSKAETNIFAGLTETQWRDARKVILHAILGESVTGRRSACVCLPLCTCVYLCVSTYESPEPVAHHSSRSPPPQARTWRTTSSRSATPSSSERCTATTSTRCERPSSSLPHDGAPLQQAYPTAFS